MDGISSKVTTVNTVTDAVKVKTDRLPIDPASQASVTSSITTAESNIRGGNKTLQVISGEVGSVQDAANGIKTRTDNLPANTALELSSINSNIDAAENSIMDELGNFRGTGGDSLKTLSDQMDGVLTSTQSIQNNTTIRIDIPEKLVLPDSGTKTYRVILGLYDPEGNPETPDAAPTLQVENISGVERLIESNMTQFTGQAGQYYLDFPLTATAPIENLIFRVKATEAGVTTYHRHF